MRISESHLRRLVRSVIAEAGYAYKMSDAEKLLEDEYTSDNTRGYARSGRSYQEGELFFKRNDGTPVPPEHLDLFKKQIRWGGQVDAWYIDPKDSTTVVHKYVIDSGD